MPTMPDTRYARTADGVHIAYQAMGDGPIDMVYVPGFVSHLELGWEWPSIAHSYRVLAEFSRLMLFDKRGTGMSDRVPDDRLPDLETRMDDVRAVMDAAGSERAVILGVSEGAPMAILFAATYPARTAALVLIGGYARELWAPDYPWGWSEHDLTRDEADIERRWGDPDLSREIALGMAPTEAVNPEFVTWFGGFLRRSVSPGAALALGRMNNRIDVRAALPVIRLPTLVLHRAQKENAPRSRHLAKSIAGASQVELPGRDHVPWSGDSKALAREIRLFVSGIQQELDLDRVLATVLFTDIVGSTERAVALGDRQWRELLGDHHRIVRAQLARFRGREVDTAGDGFLATFDGPARAIRCARAIVQSVGELGIAIRAGLHTGECELVDDKVRGIAVHTGARVAALANPQEVLVSSTVRDLVAGSGITFQDAGEHELRGIPGRWHLYRVDR
jgi:class 3 adenylate cyclase